MKTTFDFLNTANPRLQHIINTSIIFNYIFDNNLNSRAEISKSPGISAPAVLIDKIFNIKTAFHFNNIQKGERWCKKVYLLKNNNKKGETYEKA
jgi:hypothetical protein